MQMTGQVDGRGWFANGIWRHLHISNRMPSATYTINVLQNNLEFVRTTLCWLVGK